MKFDAVLPPMPLGEVPALVHAADRIGFDGLWTTETQHDPFLPLALIAEHSQRLYFGSAVAIGFARSPTTLAHTAWDLAQASSGRFILGVGTQVKGHIERRFGMPWPSSPVGKLREFIHAMRSIWSAWQEREPLDVQGEYYNLSLMTPFFSPGAIDHPSIPIYLAGVNVGMARLAGEIAQGFHVHPYHSPRYLREVLLPALAHGAAHGGRDPQDIRLSITALAASDEQEQFFIRSQIAFYASTPSYRPVMELHGWGEVADRLRTLSREGAWTEMTALVGDDMLRSFAVIAAPEEIGQALKARYDGLADHLALYAPFLPGQRDAFWRTIVQTLKGN